MRQKFCAKKYQCSKTKYYIKLKKYIKPKKKSYRILPFGFLQFREKCAFCSQPFVRNNVALDRKLAANQFGHLMFLNFLCHVENLVEQADVTLFRVRHWKRHWSGLDTREERFGTNGEFVLEGSFCRIWVAVFWILINKFDSIEKNMKTLLVWKCALFNLKKIRWLEEKMFDFI